MPDATYVIIGGGMTADAAVRGIREVDAQGSILIIGSEIDPPYKRPPLTKGLWNGTPLEDIWSNTDRLGVDLRLGRTARWLDPAAKRVADDRGTSYGFETLLLATGSTPRRLPFGDHRIIHFRTLHDYRRLRSLANQGHHFAVIGGGFIGSEIAAALAANGKRVTLIFPNRAIGDRMFPADLAQSLNAYYEERGVRVLAGASVVGLESREERSTLVVRDVETGAEHDITVDGIVAGIGTEPNVGLATSARLKVDDGIVVDRFLRTSHPAIYAAGDVANFPVTALNERRRIEHEDNAKAMGRAAGRAMAGKSEPYDHLPFFYSDLFDLGYEAVGDLDASLEMVADWTEPFRKGIVYYLRDDRVRGVLLWNVWGQVDAARALIAQAAPVDIRDSGHRLLAAR